MPRADWGRLAGATAVVALALVTAAAATAVALGAGPVRGLGAALLGVVAGTLGVVVARHPADRGAARALERLRDNEAAAVAALSDSESNYRRLFENHPQPMWVFERATLRFLEVNNAALAHYGYSRSEFLAMSLADIRPKEDVSAVMDSLSGASAREHSGPWRHLRSDGSVISVEITSHGITFAGRDARLVIVTDVSDHERLQRELERSQRIDSLGQLAGGVAHDFNNILAVIINYAAFIREDVDALGVDDEDRLTSLRHDIAQVERAAGRATALTRQLLDFARREEPAGGLLRLNTVIGEVESFLRRTLGEHVVLESSLAQDLWSITADARGLEQVLVNLAVNARDAMPGGGTLRIDTENVVVDEADDTMLPDLRPGRYVRLRVGDTGMGMPPEVLARAFEPFYTTKPKGKGTGLGLATVYGIVRRAGGHAQIHSDPGLGTTFTALFPAVEDAIETSGTVYEPSPSRAGERVTRSAGGG